ncbi:MAG: hypothetical protein ACYC9S_03530 [Leptospirales bacterium]
MDPSAGRSGRQVIFPEALEAAPIDVIRRHIEQQKTPHSKNEGRHCPPHNPSLPRRERHAALLTKKPWSQPFGCPEGLFMMVY